MSETQSAIDGLVDLVHAAKSEGSDESAAFASALKLLKIPAGDPAWTDGFDVAGEAYQRLLTNAQRRPLGQFFTPLWIGKLLAEWALEDSPRSVLDPACGTGSLLIAAQKLLGPATNTRLVGQDIDPLVLKLADVNKRVRQIGSMEFHLANFLVDRPVVESDGVVCNPPYTRHQDLDADTKERIHSGFELRLGTKFSRMASLHSLFLVRAVETAAPGASIAFITPSHWLDMNYGKTVKEFLLERTTIEAFIEFPSTERVFERVDTTATITLLRNAPPPAKHQTKFFAANTLSPGTDLSAVMSNANFVTAKQLSRAAPWHPTKRRNSGKKLGELMSVSRGLATGRNGYFVVSDEAREKIDVPSDWFVRCAPAPRFFAGCELSLKSFRELPRSVPKWLLAVPKGAVEDGGLAEYIAVGKDLGVEDAYLVQARSKHGMPWYRIPPPKPAPILFSYFNRANARFVRNSVGAVSLNNWLSVKPADGVDIDALFTVLASPECIAALKASSRVYSNGLWKVEPGEMTNVALPKSILGSLA